MIGLPGSRYNPSFGGSLFDKFEKQKAKEKEKKEAEAAAQLEAATPSEGTSNQPLEEQNYGVQTATSLEGTGYTSFTDLVAAQRKKKEQLQESRARSSGNFASLLGKTNRESLG